MLPIVLQGVRGRQVDGPCGSVGRQVEAVTVTRCLLLCRNILQTPGVVDHSFLGVVDLTIAFLCVPTYLVIIRIWVSVLKAKGFVLYGVGAHRVVFCGAVLVPEFRGNVCVVLVAVHCILRGPFWK